MNHIQKNTLSVSQVNEYLKMLLDGDPVVSNVYVRGEISNCTLPRSGHLYLTLKDEDGQLRSVMFRTYTQRLAFRPEDGMKVVAHGRISLYAPSGQYQLYIDDIQPDGAGSLAMQYEQLRRRLESEGLFDESRKKALPLMPSRIGVITSPTGAAVQDIRNILARRFPCAEMILFPSAVQGAEAPDQLRMGIEFFGMTELCDVIIIGRGGGSIEDLWSFNDEALARAIAACPIPVISAVGHESDFTICDFVADKRAPTPSAAAELAVPDKSELLAGLSMTEGRIHSLVTNYLNREKRFFLQLASSSAFEMPERVFDAWRMKLSERELLLDKALNGAVQAKHHSLSALCGKLEVMNPISVLSRGYAVVARNAETVMRAESLSAGDRVQLQFFDGCVGAVIEEQKGEGCVCQRKA